MYELGLQPAEMVKLIGKRALIAGIVQIVLGLFAILRAGVTTAVTIAVIAAVLAVTGVIDVVDFLANVKARRSRWTRPCAGLPDGHGSC